MTDLSIKSLFKSGEYQRNQIESGNINYDSYQQCVADAISTYEECQKLVDRFSLFSPNETLEDIHSSDLQYLLIHYRIAELLLQITLKDRTSIIRKAREAYEKYLVLLDHYDILSGADKKLYERYMESPTSFSTISTSDLNARRETKIANYRLEKELKKKMELLAQNPAYIESDEEILRQYHLTNTSLCAHNSFQALESLNRELEVLMMAPPSPPDSVDSLEHDYRERMGLQNKTDKSSDRLDIKETLSSSNISPLLSSNGKPLRPFTLLGNRQTLKKGVFKPGHNLPTMTIDEYLQEERARGGIIDGGGEASGYRPQLDEDNYDIADQETLKAREWDDFKESNHKGSGNTLNRG